jgi:hypothetical protein
VEVIKRNRDKWGDPSDSAVVRRALIELDRKDFKDYVVSRRAELTPMQEAEKALSMKEAKAKAEKDRGIAYCNALGGTVNGNVCTYKRYSIRHGEFEQKDALENLDDEVVANQYAPSKAEYEASLIKKTPVVADVVKKKR